MFIVCFCIFMMYCFMICFMVLGILMIPLFVNFHVLHDFNVLFMVCTTSFYDFHDVNVL